MEESAEDCLQGLPKPNPSQKRVPVPPRSILPLSPLREFRNPDAIIDLAPTFSTKEQEQEHTLPQTKLSELFSRPLYQSTDKFNLDSSNIKFACLKAFYSESAIHPSPSAA